jgi:hypothetical protein
MVRVGHGVFKKLGNIWQDLAIGSLGAQIN